MQRTATIYYLTIITKLLFFSDQYSRENVQHIDIYLLLARNPLNNKAQVHSRDTIVLSVIQIECYASFYQISVVIDIIFFSPLLQELMRGECIVSKMKINLSLHNCVSGVSVTGLLRNGRGSTMQTLKNRGVSYK